MSNTPVLRLGALGASRKPPSLASVTADMGLVGQLVDMGFPVERATKALIETGNRLGEALDWLEKNSTWEIPPEVLNESLLAAQPAYDPSFYDADAIREDPAIQDWSFVQRQGQGVAMQVDPPASAPAVTSRYASNSKEAYRERKRQKEIEMARLEKQKQLQEEARLKAEIAAERERRAGITTTSTSAHPSHDTKASSQMDTAIHTEAQTSSGSGAPAPSTTTNSATSTASNDLREYEERMRLKEVEEARKRRLMEAAERERILKEIEEDRARKFGTHTESSTTPSSNMSAAEQKAAFEAKQKEKQKEAWRLEHEENQKRLAELRRQLQEDKERKAAQREAAKANQQTASAKSAASSTIAPLASTTTTTSSVTSPSASSTTTSSTSSTISAVGTAAKPTSAVSPSIVDQSASLPDPSVPKRSIAEELAEARRARLGITKITGTQAHAAATNRSRNDEDDNCTDIDAIKARTRQKQQQEQQQQQQQHQQQQQQSPQQTSPSDPSTPMSLRELHEKRHAEQRKREQEEAERKARAERAARMLANTTALAKSSAAASSSSASSNPVENSLQEIPLETSAPDIPEPPTLISLRLPDGRIKRAAFKARDPISEVHKYAASWLPLDTIFTLFIPVPRREFTEETMSTSLQDAGLCPRGTLTVLTLQNRGTVRQAPPRPAQLEHIMRMMGHHGSEMEAAEEYANLSYDELLELQERLGVVPTGLTNREINLLPASKYQPTEDGAFCVICQLDIEQNEPIVTLPPCSHIFHKPCVEQWLKDHRNCPACRQRVKLPRHPTAAAGPSASLPLSAEDADRNNDDNNDDDDDEYDSEGDNYAENE